MNRSKTFAIATLGCKVNQVESDALSTALRQLGLREQDFGTNADIHIVNTCAVTAASDKKSRQLIRRARRANPSGLLLVMGCYAQVNPEAVQQIQAADLIVGTAGRNRIYQAVKDHLEGKVTLDVVRVGNVMQVDAFEELPAYPVSEHTRSFLKIQEGCEQYCTFCIIPYARGKLRSRELANISDEVDALLQKGFVEFVLTGIHIASYGRREKEPRSLIDVIKMLNAKKDLRRIRIGSLEPGVITDEFLAEAVKCEKLCEHFHLSLQSGNNNTLKRMNRRYTRAEYIEATKRIYEYFPDAGITTDIIVGFPGETEEDFLESISIVEEVGFSSVHVFPYSERSGTPAVKFKNKVEQHVKTERARRLTEVAMRVADRHLQKFSGRDMEILIESIQDGMSSGYTKNYIYLSADTKAGDKRGGFRNIIVDN